MYLFGASGHGKVIKDILNANGIKVEAFADDNPNVNECGGRPVLHDAMGPGISGWAQCHGRNAISWTEKFKLDVWYVDHCSLITDLKVIFITIKKVLGREDINTTTGKSATMEYFNGHN